VAPELADFLARSGLVGDLSRAVVEPLAGGVSSDIWRVQEGGRAFVVKRALPRLRVAQEWRAPVSRNAAEVAWLAEAARHAPHAVLPVLAHDPAAGLFATPYLSPATHPVWKSLLRAGRADPDTAARVGAALAAIHAGTADRPEIAGRFDHGATFRDIRIEPYLLAAARRHADLAPRLEALAGQLAALRRCLIHGDVSPKNILVGADGPVLLDAECATYGDPAFDLAFCLTHLLLKTVWVPAAAAGFLACFDTLWHAYRRRLSWETPDALEARAARLLPALLLARVDGKSPVEYLTAPADQARVRAFASGQLMNGSERLQELSSRWHAG
jgi:aminoglycoside phosphotransferase (APT) family kinase protein